MLLQLTYPNVPHVTPCPLPPTQANTDPYSSPPQPHGTHPSPQPYQGPPRTPSPHQQRRDTESLESKSSLKRHQRSTSALGLVVNLLITFLYMANQYVVAPTSGAYSELLGESKFMSGVIIGLSPLAALVSALVYSHWTNYSFKVSVLGVLVHGLLG